jgi:hypothetical protein
MKRKDTHSSVCDEDTVHSPSIRLQLALLLAEQDEDVVRDDFCMRVSFDESVLFGKGDEVTSSKDPGVGRQLKCRRDLEMTVWF